MVPSFCHILTSQQQAPQKAFTLLMGPEKATYTTFSILCKIPSFGCRVTSLTLKLPYKNPKKVEAIWKRLGKPSWMAFS